LQAYQLPRATVQQVLQHCELSQTNCNNTHVSNVLNRIKNCRTAAFGYHLYRCSNEACRYLKYQYHSCRDRHCPNCGAIKKQQWIEARTQELLPVKYYHVVFTLPHELNPLVLGHRNQLFKVLFNASSQTLLSFANDTKYLNAQPGIISVLHTWGQQLSFHPHVHCIVSGGGITSDNTWKDAKKNRYGFLFPVKAMQAVFRGKFLQSLQQLIDRGEVTMPQGTEAQQLFNLLYNKDWVVYAKAPFSGPHTVIEYLGRYTHKVAISNHRIAGINKENQTVTFEYKDYADNNNKKQMTLPLSEFIRRFQQHILPPRFTKIRTYGYLSNRNRHQRINHILKSMKLPLHKPVLKVPLQLQVLLHFSIDITECPCCISKTMQLIQIYYPWKQSDDG
jgi:hypothetical protein